VEKNMTKNNDKRLIQSVERAYKILKCFEENRMLRITDISNMLSLHKSTTFGLVSTLEEFNLLEQDDQTGMYKLGMELFKLGAHVDINLRSIVAPYIDNLVAICQETVNLVGREDDLVFYIEKKESPHSMRICTKLGQELPMYCTAVGKAILASLDPCEAEDILQRTEFRRYTNNTHRTVKAVKEELIKIRLNGYAVDNEELEYGLVCIGVAIVDRKGSPVGGISVSGPVTRMDDKMLQKASELLIEYANQIKLKL
jgi:IclR family transcriptional regulator, KDG regulon repressor